jgi:hypothetical protein
VEAARAYAAEHGLPFESGDGYVRLLPPDESGPTWTGDHIRAVEARILGPVD